MYSKLHFKENTKNSNDQKVIQSMALRQFEAWRKNYIRFTIYVPNFVKPWVKNFFKNTKS